MNRSLLVTAAGAALLLAASPGVSGGEIVAYVSSLTEDSIVRLRDTNGDGDLNDAGESAVFFGPGNADGWLGVGSAQAILVLGPDHVLAADGEESGGYVTRVYRLRDRNGDGDAMDAGEATEFWDSILPLGVNYDRPKAMTVGPDGAIYLADNNTINFDYDTPEAVWRLEDLNADGDVNDPGEVTLYLQLSPADSHFGFICEDFKWDAAGRLWFSNQDSSSNTGTVWIVEPDLTLRQFVSDSDDLLGIGLNKTGMTLHPETGNPVLGGYDVFENRRILELVDLNGNGVIDDVDETLSRYRSDVAAEPLLWDLNNVMDVDYAPDGALWLLDNAHKTVLRFEDLGGDGDYLDPGEAGRDL